MAEFKLVISDPKTGKSTQKEVQDANAKKLMGLKIGQTFKGEIIDLTGYEFEIRGGSDSAGFMMFSLLISKCKSSFLIRSFTFSTSPKMVK